MKSVEHSRSVRESSTIDTCSVHSGDVVLCSALLGDSTQFKTAGLTAGCIYIYMFRLPAGFSYSSLPPAEMERSIHVRIKCLKGPTTA